MPIDFSHMISQVELLLEQRKLDEAEAVCCYILTRAPDLLEAVFLSGNIAFSSSRWLDAGEHFRHASELDPLNPVILNNYGLSLLEAARNSTGSGYELLKQSVDLFKQVVDLSADYSPGLLNLGLAHKELGNFDEAVRCFSIVRGIDPNNADVLMQLGALYTSSYNFDKAIDCYLNLLNRAPQDPAEVLNRIATLYCYTGDIAKSVDFFRQAIEIAPIPEQKRYYASSRLFALHYLAQISPEEMADEHYSWGNRYFHGHESAALHNSSEIDRILRIGYVSGDFRMNAVSFFIQPILAAHDQEKFEIYCYSNVQKKDSVTDQLIQKHRITWREIRGISDEEACSMIRDDRIDILIDLAGHCGENRLPLFSLRPAPVQATWIGYPDTTGLSSIDCRITDAKADPPGQTEHLHTEELVRLPRTFLCYNPGSDFPVEGTLPYEQNGSISFGTMSNFSKINEPLLDIWCRILSGVPGSRLILRYRGQEWERINTSLSARLELHGISSSRLKLLGHARSVNEQLEAYRLIDIALDTFPYHGTTTTCEALYMGVPVITLAGRSHYSRVGVSLLETVGLTDFIACDKEEYIGKSVSLAHNLPLLMALRQNLRSMLLGSPLCDNITFTSDLEELYRSLWLRWCSNAGHGSR